MRISRKTASQISTIMGYVVAISNAWINVDWHTFKVDAGHIMPLFFSAMVALGGHMTSINVKHEDK